MRILFLSRWFPYPPDNGSKIRIFNLLRQLASKGNEVVLVSFEDQARPQEMSDALRQYCTEVHTVPYRPFQPTRLSAVAALLSPRPRSVVDTYNKEMEQKVLMVAAAFQPDLVVATEIDMAPYALLVRNTKHLLDELQLTVLQEAVDASKSGATTLRRFLTWQKHVRYVAATLKHFDGCTVVSEKEFQQVKCISKGSTQIEIIPNGVDIAQTSGSFGEPCPNTLIYTGALSFDANLDAMHYFVQKIFPLILAHNPQVALKITGSIKNVPIQELPVHPNLTLTGYLADLRPTIAKSYLSIVPLRIGGGTRLKILESLALGTPVVTTSKGIEGLNIAPYQGVLVADTPATFADAVLNVLRNPELRQELSIAGRIAVQPYDWQHSGQSLHNLIDQIMLPLSQRQLQSID